MAYYFYCTLLRFVKNYRSNYSGKNAYFKAFLRLKLYRLFFYNPSVFKCDCCNCINGKLEVVCMIKLMIVAGEQTNELAKHLGSSGVFKVDFAYKNLYEYEEEIRNSIITVDKFLYVYQSTQMKSRLDMSILQNLITNDGFFKTKEIVFIQKESEDAIEASKYFQAVMSECKLEAKETGKRFNIVYSVNTVKGKLSFQEINSYLLGTTQIEDFHNTKSKFYRYEKGNPANKAYVPEKAGSYIIEPFQHESVYKYDKAKANALKIESGQKFESLDDKDIASYDNPIIGTLQNSGVLLKTHITLFMGDAKSGKSVWASALASSAIDADKCTLVLNFAKNRDIVFLLELSGSNFKEVSMFNLLSESELKQGVINVCTPSSDKEFEVIKDFLFSFLEKLDYSNLDEVFIVAEKEIIQYLCSTHKNKITNVFYFITPLKSNLEAARTKLIEIFYSFPLTIFLNKEVQLFGNIAYYNYKEVKSFLNFKTRIVDSIHFDDLNVDRDLYDSIFAVSPA